MIFKSKEKKYYIKTKQEQMNTFKKTNKIKLNDLGHGSENQVNFTLSGIKMNILEVIWK